MHPEIFPQSRRERRAYALAILARAEARFQEERELAEISRREGGDA